MTIWSRMDILEMSRKAKQVFVNGIEMPLDKQKLVFPDSKIIIIFYNNIKYVFVQKGESILTRSWYRVE